MNINQDKSSSHMAAARYWSPTDDGRVRCELCPRFCRLLDGQRGVCFVRMRQGDQLLLTTYGRSTGFCVDPIEKKPLYHFYPGSAVLSFGTAGCNLKCKFCQNWDITTARDTDRRAEDATPQMIAQAARRLGCRSVAFTYNDPVVFLEYDGNSGTLFTSSRLTELRQRGQLCTHFVSISDLGDPFLTSQFGEAVSVKR